MQVPGVIASTLARRLIRTKTLPYVPGSDVLLSSTATDSGSTPTSRIREGNVIVKKTSDGKFYINDGQANAQGADRNTAATVQALENATAAWNSLVLTFTLGGASGGGTQFTVTLGAGTATEAAAVTDLTGNAVFAANLVADVNSTFLRIRTRAAGEGVYLNVKAAARASTFGASGTDGIGVDADYRVTEDPVDMLDLTGAAADQVVRNVIVGRYKRANIINLTGEAELVLARKGSIFE